MVKCIEDRVSSSCQAYYALLVFTVLTAVNQLHRYLLIAAIEPMSNDLKFGDKECHVCNESATHAFIQENDLNITNVALCAESGGIRCVNESKFDNETLCQWHYMGTGLEYEILAGPVFIIVLGVLGVPVTILAELGHVNRRNVVGVCAFCWSLTIIFTGLAQTLGEVYLWRFLLGFFEAPFNPFSISMLASFFGPSRRGLAIGLAASGSYAGYGMSYAFIALVDVIGWRWVYISTGIAGTVLGLLTLLTVSNPYVVRQDDDRNIVLGSMRDIWAALKLEPWFILIPIFLAFACKMGYQYTLSYNLNNYFVEYFPDFPTDVYLSWVVALAGILAFCLGGGLSDFFGKRFGALGRLSVIVVIEIIQIPLYVCFILLGLPENLILGTIGIVIGDGWLGIGMSAMADIVGTNIRTVIYALFFCVMDVIGGCVIVAVSPLTAEIGFRLALLYLGTGMLIGGTVLIAIGIVALVIFNKRQRSTYSMNQKPICNGEIEDSTEKSPLLANETTST